MSLTREISSRGCRRGARHVRLPHRIRVYCKHFGCQEKERERERQGELEAASIIVATISGINYLHHGTVVVYYGKFVVAILKTC